MNGQYMQDFMSASDYENPNCTAPYYDPWCEHYQHEGLVSCPHPSPEASFLDQGIIPSFRWARPRPRCTRSRWRRIRPISGASGSRVSTLTRPIHVCTEQPVTETTCTGSCAFLKLLGCCGERRQLDRVPGRARSRTLQGNTRTDTGHPTLEPEPGWKETDAWLRSLGSITPKPEEILSHGMPGGGLREALTGRPLTGGACPFPSPTYDSETGPWLDLLHNGTFSPATLRRVPV